MCPHAAQSPLSQNVQRGRSPARKADAMERSTVATGMQAHQLVRRTVALVLAGGRGSRLKQLTDKRAKPAVYFGGKFRIIDFALSNCVNSGIRRIGVVTQYKSHSLLRHLQRGWSFLRAELNEVVDLLPAQQRINEEHWYRGTADAVYQNLDIIQSSRPEYVVVLAGDHVYKMDYSLMLSDHVERGAGCTVGCIEVPRMEAVGFGVMEIDEARKIVAFVEKPADPPPMPGKPDVALASMGIYIFDAAYLYQLLEEDIANPNSAHDFGKDVIPRAVAEGRAQAHPFGMSCVANPNGSPPYWRDVARSTPSGPPTSTSHRSTPSSTSTTPSGRSGPTSASCRRPSSSPTRTARTASPSTPSSRAAASSAAHRSSTRCSSPACACTRSATSTRPSCFPM